MIARVLPDVPALSSKTFDYLVPEKFGDQVRVGTLVRVDLHGRRVGGWVVALDETPATERALKPIAKVTGWGPAPELVDLARWAAWRWAGRISAFLGTASPPHAVAGLPSLPARAPVPAPPVRDDLALAAWHAAPCTLRLPPSHDPFVLVLEAARRGPALVLTPSVSAATHLGLRLRRAGVPVAIMPREWAAAAAGGCAVIGARAAAWAPVPGLAAAVVLDEHDEGYAEERAPTWNARDVVVERARRAGVPFVLASPVPSLEALDAAPLVTPGRREERDGWPMLDVADRRRDDPSTGLYSRRLVDLLRSGRRVVCVLNRKGRARLLACAACGELARCESCGAAVEQREQELVCRRCATARPLVCLACGAARMKTLRPGVTKVRDELEALAGVPVVEVTGDEGDDRDVDGARVLVGTEAVLHRAGRADAVAFLDFDQELLAPRYRAAEEALGLLARAARLTGPRTGGGRVLVQTRLPRHEVIEAALHADPSRVSDAERDRRKVLGFPPFAALALVSGDAAEPFTAALREQQRAVDVLGPADGRWLVRAPDRATLSDALAAVPRPPGRLRVEVDPVRL